jgi:hypothetical protein
LVGVEKASLEKQDHLPGVCAAAPADDPSGEGVDHERTKITNATKSKPFQVAP